MTNHPFLKPLALLATILLVSTMAMAAHKRVLYIGDSITDGGWGRSGGLMKPTSERNLTDLNHLYGHSFMMLCAAHYMSLCPDSDYVFINRGISGNTLADVAARWQPDALDLQPDVVTLLVGTNDADRYLAQRAKNPDIVFDYPAWQQQYEQLLSQLQAQNPHVKIILGTPFVDQGGNIGNRPDFAERRDIIARLARIIEDIARRHGAALLPYHEMFASLVQSQPRPHYWIWDGIHPTAAGHQRMADLWIATADRLHILN